MNSDSSHSVGGTAVFLPSVSMQRSVFDNRNEGDAPLQPVRRRPSNDTLDIMPQPPVRQESCSLQSQTLFDLDPRDSVPRPPRRRSSTHLHSSAHRKIQTRTRDELSSCGSSLLSPPSSVLVPQDSSMWSEGISTLMSHDDDERFASIPPHRQEEDSAFIAREKLPWDKIAIGVVCEASADKPSSDHRPTTQIEITVVPPSDELRSQDTVSYPSFQQSSTSQYQGIIQPQSRQDASVFRDQPPSLNASHIRQAPTCLPQLEYGDHVESASAAPFHLHNDLLEPPQLVSKDHVITRRNDDRSPWQTYQSVNGPSPTTPSNVRIPPPLLEHHTVAQLPTMHTSAKPPIFRPRGTTPRNNVPSSLGRPQHCSDQTLQTEATLIHCPSDVTTIEVAPGIRLPLRGTEETWKAIEEGQVTVTTCMTCQQDLHCVLDAQMVVCPDCTMLSPVDQTSQDAESLADRYGVGLGVKPEDVLRWFERHRNRVD